MQAENSLSLPVSLQYNGLTWGDYPSRGNYHIFTSFAQVSGVTQTTATSEGSNPRNPVA